MKKNGFTLIELLSVLAILSLIILIAYPIITKTIHDSRKNSAVDSAYGYIRAVESSAANDAINHPGNSYTGTYQINGKNIVNSSDSSEVLAISYNGVIPSGTLTMSKRTVRSANLKINNFQLQYDGRKVKAVS